MRSNRAKQIAIGGVLAAVAVVIMCLGGLIPIATYVCPMLCTMTQFLVLRFCDKKISWAWFAVVAFLSLLFGPDKEAVLVFVAIGYYPLIKQKIEMLKLPGLVKILYFSGSVLTCYGVMIYLFGMQQIVAENEQLGLVGLAFLLLLGNVAFLMLDNFLSILSRKLR